ncbi:NAD(P)-dependent dehydrogenase, short-chain alcohol dehydrogenase family [Nonomuraea maritima]|uniref:NAD(P)-dependent dehydrogenase, short-chain alcohol dehydrogenase family n=1 Tax=Nonomuraea maritima TaxID=683260 RepID=A0A1G8WUA5_9ACTN|nr:SDR family oxidoreductase [Nonomuraea maritima]SDJ81215.1 NAD(P)-dependent dehydrogenase, short-chain alcohol dehydrogenase family [Nonomuraea maritima]
MPHHLLRGHVALVTGAGSGIGRACALGLAEAGATVAVTDLNPDTARQTHELIAEQGGSSAAYTLDVTEDSAWEAVLNDVRATFAPVIVLVNNAALKASVAGDGGLLDTPVPVWDRVFAANLRGPMLGARRVLPDMLEAGTGSIIMMTSTSALHSVAGFATAYSSAKAGMIGLTRMIAATYGTQGVRCNAIAPGVIMLGDDTASQEAFRESSGGLTQRPGRPTDIASTVVFLAGQAGEYINGQVLVVDGGLTTHMPGLSKKARA